MPDDKAELEVDIVEHWKVGATHTIMVGGQPSLGWVNIYTRLILHQQILLDLANIYNMMKCIADI